MIQIGKVKRSKLVEPVAPPTALDSPGGGRNNINTMDSLRNQKQSESSHKKMSIGVTNNLLSHHGDHLHQSYRDQYSVGILKSSGKKE